MTTHAPHYEVNTELDHLRFDDAAEALAKFIELVRTTDHVTLSCRADITGVLTMDDGRKIQATEARWFLAFTTHERRKFASSQTYTPAALVDPNFRKACDALHFALAEVRG